MYTKNVLTPDVTVNNVLIGSSTSHSHDGLLQWSSTRLRDVCQGLTDIQPQTPSDDYYHCLETCATACSNNHLEAIELR